MCIFSQIMIIIKNVIIILIIEIILSQNILIKKYTKGFLNNL